MTQYVNNADNLHEQKVLEFVASRWKCKHVQSLEKKASFDGFLYRYDDMGFEKYDRPKALVEVRKLNCSSTQYNSAMISYTKIQNWQSLFPVLNMPCYFVVNWFDKLGFADIADIAAYGDIRVSPFSKNRRNPENDREIVFHYPVIKFKTLGTFADAQKLHAIGKTND